MRDSYPSWIETAVVGYCSWQASDLPHSWYSSPLVRWAWMALLIWCLPVVWHLITSIKGHSSKGSNPLFLGLAIASSLIGSIGSLHFLQHFGFALALAGLVPLSWPMLLWVPSAVAWMPAFGWFFRYYGSWTIFLMELGIACVGTCAMWIWRQRRF